MSDKLKTIELSDAELNVAQIKTVKPKLSAIDKAAADERLAEDINELMNSRERINTSKTQNTADDVSASLDDMLDFSSQTASADDVNSIEAKIDEILKESDNINEGSKDIIAAAEYNRHTASKKKRKKKKSLAYNTVMVFLICVFVGCLAYLLNYYFKARKSEAKFDDLRDLIIVDNGEAEGSVDDYMPVTDEDGNVKFSTTVTEPEYVEVEGRLVQKKYSELYKRNQDFLGWLTIGDTVVNYPVMYTPSQQDYYLHRDFDKEYSDSGILFVDNNCDVVSGDNLIIYGHNMLSGKMFASLTNYDDEEYYQKYKYIKFDTIDEDGVYEVIAAFRSKIYKVDYTGFKYYQFYGSTNEEEFNNYVNNCRALTPYNTSDAEYGDKLITLSTCAYHTTNGRFVVVAKKVK